jgi:DNA-binding CsgD family transcriptional regulator/PAS domain-containing protein
VARSVRSEEIFEGLFDDEAFARLPALLADAVGARSSIIQWRRLRGDFEVAGYSNFTAETVASYGETWRALDPWASAAMSPQRTNRLGLLEELVPQDQFARTTFYNDFCRPEADDIFHCMGAGFSTAWGDGLFGLLRGRSESAFEARDLDLFRPYARAALRVLNVRGELAAERRRGSMAEAALDTLGLAVITIDHRGHLRSANEAAEAVLKRGDGLLARGGGVSARMQADGNSLRTAIGRATAGADPSARAVSISRAGNKPPYMVTISPVVGGGRARRAILVFSDPDASDASLADRLRTLFGLSPAEASIAMDIGRGRSPDEIAIERRVRRNTLRAQLKSVAAKMGCSRQAEIAALIAALPTLRSGDAAPEVPPAETASTS